MPYVIRLEGELVPNCVIKIHGMPSASTEWDSNVKEEQSIFSIGLYHNAIEHIPKHLSSLFIYSMQIVTIISLFFNTFYTE
jgi:hypothetical protein